MKTNKRPNIFIVEDDPFYQEIVKHQLGSKYSSIEVYSSGEDCLANMHKNPDVILLDYDLGENMNGIQILKRIKEEFPQTEVIILSAQEKMEVAANSIKYGAFDYVSKTEAALMRVETLIERILKINSLVHENKMHKKLQVYAAATLGVGLFIAYVLSQFYPIYFD